MTSQYSLEQRRKIVQRYNELEHVKALLDHCFPEQRAFILDPCKRKAALNSRRSGKSEAAGVYLLMTALVIPKSKSIYLGMNRGTARDTMWDPIFKRIINELKIPVTFNEGELTMRFPNGSSIKVAGADYNEAARDKLRGQYFHLAIIDEPQSWQTDVGKLIQDTIGPQVHEKDGTIVLIGTPGLVKNFFHDVVMEVKNQSGGLVQPGWSIHKWSALVNPHVKWSEILEIEKAKLGPTWESTPSFLREYLGQWVLDDSNLVYHFSLELNLSTGSLPKLQRGDEWTYCMGADTGWVDDSAIVVVAWNRTDPTLYVVNCWKSPKLDLTAFTDMAKQLKAQHGTKIHVIDGKNKIAVEEMRNRQGMAWESAEQHDKFQTIDQMNDDLAYGRIKVLSPECEPLVKEWQELVLDPRQLVNNKKRVEDSRCANHLADACLYAWRKSYHYRSRPDRVQQELSPDEAFRQRMREMATKQAVKRDYDFKVV